MASIRCGHCGGEHGTVAEVRACHDRAADAPSLFTSSAGDERPSVSAVVAPFADEPARPPVPAGPHEPASALAVLAGPDVLGRWLAVRPGQEAPPPWSDAPRHRIDAAAVADPEPLLDALRPMWLARRRVVIEIADGCDAPPAAVEQRDPWMLDPSFTFASDELTHLLWSNTVDGRDIHRPQWSWATMAIGLGASPSARSDIVLAGGAETWCDGGPLSPAPSGLTVVHRIALEHRSLTPLGTLGGKPSASAAGLAPDQLAAVTHAGGAARIIAPAGSGKTRVLTERARHLLHDWHVPPSALTLVAFNVRAADEMRERTADLPGLQVRTLNALALAIVNGAGRFASRRAGASTINERDVRRIIDSLVKLPRKANADPTAVWIEALSAVRLGLRDPSEVEAAFGGEVPGFATMFPHYRDQLRANGQVDFDEQITAAIVALLTEPATRAAAQRACRVLLVDEFQDLAPAHLLLLRLVASPEMAVFGVGDDDQTIYGYAGATPEWLIGFDRLFPGAGHHPLEVNYRCPPAVVHAAATLLSHNRRRVRKLIRPAPQRVDDDRSLTIVDTDDLVSATVECVKAHAGNGVVASDIAVLTRVNASLAPVQVALRHHGIAATAVVGPAYLERGGVRVALAWLRGALAPDRLRGSDIDLTARRPGRGLSPKVVEWMAGCRNREALTRLAGRLSNERDADKVAGFVADIELLAARAQRGAPTAELLAVVRDRVGLDEAMAKLDRSRADAQSTHVDDLDALVGLARLHPDPATFGTWLHDELSAPGDPAGVMLSSIHRVKGREWRHVVVHDVRDGVVPHRLANDREEERRVFHVGITRAIESVTIVGDEAHRSPFIDQLTTPPAERAPRNTVVVDPSGSSRGPRSGDRRNGLAGNAPRSAGDESLRDALRTWRTQRAKDDAVPAYVVCTNVTLDAIVDIRPRTLDELRAVPGIGPAKRERYGQAIIDLVNASHTGP